eukprot:Tbor_TRINITY_DN5213_c5_g7::TRINITY_DN5213_c5_g7_i1::g.16237::m.16237/K20471/COPD, ARCN1, RET2; coatomer subunit delta
MSIISVGIVNKQGKVILSRQFTDVSRIRIEGLLSAFPRILGTGPVKQCTFIETGSVRYVYQPLESLFLVLVTTMNCNIVEGLATLSLMGRLIPEYVLEVTEQQITQRAFEILFAFDEVVVKGNRENCTMENVITYLAMESHEEDMAREEKKKQILAAKKVAQGKAKEIRKHSAERRYNGIGGEGEGGYADEVPKSYMTHQPTENYDIQPMTTGTKKPGVGGMSLGKARNVDMTAKVLAEAGLSNAKPVVAVGGSSMEQVVSDKQGVIHINVTEKISATINRDGGVVSLDVRGFMSIQISDAHVANVRVHLKPYNDDFSFKTHTKINKNMFTSDRVLSVKDNKPYATHQTLEILRWRMESGKIKTPLTVTCWPGENSANVEYDLEDSSLCLENVRIMIPIAGAGPSITECSDGECGVVDKCLIWSLQSISRANSTGSIEFDLKKEIDPNAYFPIKVDFVVSNLSLAGVAVADVVNTENGMPVPFTKAFCLSTDEYQIC